MALSDDQIRFLTDALNGTRERELDCDEFLVHLAAWSERVLNGEQLSSANDVVQHHLEICHECKEEFDALLEVLESGSQPGEDSS